MLALVTMPVSYKLLPEKQLGYVAFYGSFSGVDMIEASRFSLTDPSWCSLPMIIWDGREITGLEFDLASVHRMADLISAHGAQLPPSRHAIIVRREQDWILGRLVLYLIRLKKRELRLFRTMEEGAAWLGVRVDCSDLVSKVGS